MKQAKLGIGLRALVYASPLVLAACGGGSSSSSSGGPTDAERSAAATATANNNTQCSTSELGSYYWEIGDEVGAKVSGTVGSGAPAAGTVMNIASASKWLYSAYVVQSVGVRDEDVEYLNFTSGYSNFLPICLGGETVETCLDNSGSGEDPSTVGKFAYNGGHMQHHAVAIMGLGPLTEAQLATEIQSQIGNHGFGYTQPELAGGANGSASGYAAFLRDIITGELAMRDELGTHEVCTNPTAQGCNAVASPGPTDENWGYALGHWVEDDPARGDGAYSSPGAFGFYPWISADKTLYGVLAREELSDQAGFKSALCGRLIRQAWVTGQQVTATVPSPAQ